MPPLLLRDESCFRTGSFSLFAIANWSDVAQRSDVSMGLGFRVETATEIIKERARQMTDISSQC